MKKEVIFLLVPAEVKREAELKSKLKYLSLTAYCLEAIIQKNKSVR